MKSNIFIIFLLLFPFIYCQDDCSFISGEGCLNGICKYCAMCITTDCILATPYSTGDNEGSTCAVTHQLEGYDFYNYCLSSGDDTDGDYCGTNTLCYHYEQGNLSNAMHAWDKLTCDQDSCFLINSDGSQPIVPATLDTDSNINNNNVSSNHPIPGTGSGNKKIIHHDSKQENNNINNNPTMISIITVCTFISLCLFALSIRIIFYKTKYWDKINKYFCCSLCQYKPRNETTDYSTAPPSFRSEMVMRSNNNSDLLPCYSNQDASPPKYEQAIVTQIRGMRTDYNPSSSGQQQQQPIWVPVYIRPNTGNYELHQDWATQTMRHQTSTID